MLSVRAMSTVIPGIAGVILAGGQSRRMGGGDKTLLDLGGKPMLAHVIARLAAQAEPLAISANGDPERFEPFGLPVVADADFAYWFEWCGIPAIPLRLDGRAKLLAASAAHPDAIRLEPGLEIV